MSRRRQQRRAEKARRHTPPLLSAEPTYPPAAESSARAVVREASQVERLAYTRSQAAQALGISRSTFIRRVLPHIETIEMPWGARLIPIDELERLVAERRRAAARGRAEPGVLGRPPVVPADVAERIRSWRAAGRSLREIAAELNADGTATAHGGVQWWPSTVRGVLRRARV
jgi:DNA invertase Pin-like site-specific DNA recombinase